MQGKKSAQERKGKGQGKREEGKEKKDTESAWGAETYTFFVFLTFFAKPFCALPITK